MNACLKFRDQLEDVALGDPATPELSRHLAACTACAAELERRRALARRLDDAVHAIVRAEPPPQVAAGVAARLTAARGPAARPGLRPWYAALAVAAAVALLLGFGIRMPERPPVAQSQLSALAAWHSPTASLLEPLGTLSLPHPTPGATHDS